MDPDLDPDSLMDKGIAPYVRALRAQRVETYESCEGGEGHSSPEPVVRFHGGASEGYRAVGVALQQGLPVYSLRRAWTVIDGELVGPCWEITFKRKARYGPAKNPSAGP